MAALEDMAALEGALSSLEGDSPEVDSKRAESAGAEPSAASTGAAKPRDRPTCCLVVGMAGAGKTTLMQRLNHYAVEQAEIKLKASKASKASKKAKESGGDGPDGGGAAASGGGGGSGVGSEDDDDADLDAPTYYVNMDPAVTQVPFAAGIDIRDTVDYKQVTRLDSTRLDWLTG